MLQTQLVETPIIAVATNMAQRLLAQDDRRIYVGIWPSQTGPTTYISTNPSNFGGFSGTAPVLFASGQNGPTWELYYDRHRGLVKREWWIYPSSMPGTYIGTTIEWLEWDDGIDGVLVPLPFAIDPHILVPGVDVPDRLTELVRQLKQARQRIRG